MPEVLASRIYDLKVANYDDTFAKVQKLTTAFNKMDTAKRKLNEQLQRKLSAGDTAAVEKLTGRIKDLEKQMASLDKQREKSAREAALLARAEKDLAKAGDTRIQSQIRQEKELDRQIAQEEKQRKALEKEKVALDALPGSYNAVRNSISQLRPLLQNANASSVISFKGQNLSFDQAIGKFRELSLAEQDFRRQFQADGTLVSEYSAGIVKAFNKLGLNDVINNNRGQIQSQLRALRTENEQLAASLQRAGTIGSEGFGRLETKLRENISLEEQLEKQLVTINTTLAHTGSVGQRITGAINDGFKSIKSQVSSVLFQYIGLQAAISQAQSTFRDIIKLDSLGSSLKVVSENEVELAKNNQFLQKTTEDLGLEYLSTAAAFKNFYAAATQAGISADETRRIFFAASSAAANLKLSQEDANGVLLAFSQIASKGKVQAEELRGQIGERVPGAFSIAAKAMGVTQQQLNKMLETGQVLSSEFLPKFATELQKTFAGDTPKRVEGLQASINRLKNEIIDVLKNNQQNITVFISGVVSVLGFLIGHLELTIPLIVTIIGLTNSWTGTLIRLTAAYSLQITAWIIERAQLIANNAVRATTNFLLAVYTASLARATLATGAASLASRILAASIALLTGPVGIVIGVIAALVTVVGIFSASAKEASATMAKLTENQRIYAEQQKITKQLQIEVNKENAVAKDQIQSLVGVLKSATASYDEKARALKNLIAISPEYLSGLTQENINTQEGINIINRYIQKLDQLADAKARVNLKASLKEQLLQSQTNSDALLLEQQNKGQISNTKKFFFGKDGKLFGFGDRNRFDVDEDLKKERQKIDDINLKLKALDNSNTQQITSLQKSIADNQTKLKAVKEGSEEAKKLAQDIATDQQTLFTIEGIENPTTVVPKPAGEQGLTDLKAQLKTVNDQITTLVKIKNLTDVQKKQLEGLRKERNEINAKIKELGGGSKPTGSKISVDDNEKFKNIDARRDQAIADQKLLRAQNLIDEENYLKTVLAINQKAIDEKLKLLKGANGEEKKVIADLRLERITIEQETNNKLFDQRKETLKAQLDEEIKNLQERNRLVQDDPNSSATAKANSKKQTDQAILDLTIKYGNDITALAKQYGQQSIKNEKEVADQIRQIKEDLQKDEKEIAEAQLKDAEDAANKDIASFKKNIEAQRLAIIQSNKPQRKKDAALSELKNQEEFGVLAREVARDTIEKEIYEKLLKAKVVTQEQYDNFLAEAYKREQQLHQPGIQSTEKAIENVTTLGQLVTNKLSNVFGFDNGTAEGAAREKLLAETIAQSYQFAQNAMNNYFDAERDRIEKSKEIVQKRIELEKQQALNTATSQAERDSIEREAQVKKDQADREAFEKNKKIQLQQAKINLGIQLSNLAVIAFAPNPANIATLGVAGDIMYAAQAVIAIASYASNVKKIQSAQYATGGYTGPGSDRDSSGHRVAGVVHDNEWVAPKWMVQDPKYAGVIGTLEKERKRGYSGGGYAGIDYSGSLGDNLRPPLNPSEFLNPANGGSSVDIVELKKMVAQQTINLNETGRQIHERIDKLQVHVNAGEVEKTNSDVKKVIAMGTL